MTLFAYPEQQQQTQQAFQRFTRAQNSHNPAILANIRPSVAQSWQRSKENGINPEWLATPSRLNAQALQAQYVQHNLLLTAAKPVWQQISNDFGKHSQHLTVLTTPQGDILHTQGNTQLMTAAEQIGLSPAGEWQEQHCGTNAIGTALRTHSPIQILGQEHYCQGMKQWSCSAAPIYYPGHNILMGILDLSSLASHHHPNHLRQAIHYASLIEGYLFLQEREYLYILHQAFFRQVEHSQDPYALLDRHGHLILNTTHLINCLSQHQLTLEDLRANIPHHASHSVSPHHALEYSPIMYQEQIIGYLCHINPSASDSPTTPQHQLAGHPAFAQILGKSDSLTKACRQAEKIASTWSSILLQGETGVGKELFAHAIHNASPARDQPIITLNCGTLTTELLNSELFGYVEGAFTGARKGGMVGKIEAANGGTLFLDEIGELPLSLQPHLLRVLESGEYYRLGDAKIRYSHFRLIAASHANLKEMCAQGRFRSDLYYRIAVSTLHIPALHQRRQDIPILVEKILQHISQQNQKPYHITTEALAILCQAPWPGNIRQLRNVVEHMAIMSENGTLGIEWIPEDIIAQQAQTAAPEIANASEAEHLSQAILACSGNLSQAAKQLSIAKSTLYLKIKQYELADIVAQSRANNFPPHKAT